MKPVVLHADAEAELREALDYYETQRAGLGGEFRREFETARYSACARIPWPMPPKTTPEFSIAHYIGFPTRLSMWSWTTESGWPPSRTSGGALATGPAANPIEACSRRKSCAQCLTSGLGSVSLASRRLARLNRRPAAAIACACAI